MRELTDKEKEQRRMIDERFKGREYPSIDPMEIGLPVCDETSYEEQE